MKTDRKNSERIRMFLKKCIIGVELSYVTSISKQSETTTLKHP